MGLDAETTRIIVETSQKANVRAFQILIEGARDEKLAALEQDPVDWPRLVKAIETEKALETLRVNRALDAELEAFARMTPAQRRQVAAASRKLRRTILEMQGQTRKWNATASAGDRAREHLVPFRRGCLRGGLARGRPDRACPGAVRAAGRGTRQGPGGPCHRLRVAWDVTDQLPDPGGARAVTLVRQESRAVCAEGRSWGWGGTTLWVDAGCAGLFRVAFDGFGGSGGSWGGSGGSWEQSSQHHGGGGSGGAVAGGLLAAGLIAALVAAGKSANHGSGPPAQLQASLREFPSASRTEAQACLNEAARQVGATGGTSVRLDRVIASRQQPDGAWRHQALLTKVWPDHRQQMRMDCVASGSRVRAFDVS